MVVFGRRGRENLMKMTLEFSYNTSFGKKHFKTPLLCVLNEVFMTPKLVLVTG